MVEPQQQVPVGRIVTDATLVYGEYINGQRALVADDGLKPVMRRILYSMLGLKLKPGGKSVKSARVVGDTMGKLHPHGDAAIYGTLVGGVFARYPLVQGVGNFGDPLTGDPPAAMRYTECAPTALAIHALSDVDVVPMMPTYDGDSHEPLYLAGAVPLLLLNGSTGIGEAVAGSLPPHNLREIASVLRWVLNHSRQYQHGGEWRTRPRFNSRDTKWVHKLFDGGFSGPDAGSGVLLTRPQELIRFYTEGRGTVRFRCDYHIEDSPKGDGIQQLVITDPAPGWSSSRFEEKANELAKEGWLLRAYDASTVVRKKRVVKIVVEFRDAGPISDRVLPLLETTLSFNFNTVKASFNPDTQEPHYEVVVGQNLYDLCRSWIQLRLNSEWRVLLRDEATTLREISRLEAIITARNNLRAFTKAIEEAETDEELISMLVERLRLTVEQVEMLLSMQVRSLSRTNIQQTQAKLDAARETLSGILHDKSHLTERLLRQLDELEVKFGDDRGTKLAYEATDFDAVSAPKLVLIHRGGSSSPTIERPSDPKARLTKGRKRIKATDVLIARDWFLIVYRSGTVRKVKLSYVSDGKHPEWSRKGDPIVNIVSDEDSLILASVDGGGVAVCSTDQRHDEWSLFRKETEGQHVLSAVGMSEHDHIVLHEKDKRAKARGRYRDFAWASKYVKRPNSKPSRMLPHGKHVNLIRLRPGAVLYRPDGKGYKLPVENNPKRLHLVEADNCLIAYEGGSIVLLEDGRKKWRHGKREGLPVRIARSLWARQGKKEGNKAAHVLSYEHVARLWKEGQK